MDLRTVVVVGATGAVGSAAARAFVKRGSRVVLLARSAAKARSLTQTIVADSGNDAQVETELADLGDFATVRTACARLRERHQRLDVLVLSAAAFESERRTLPNGHELMFATNHLGPFLLIQELMPLLQRAAPARVIHVVAPGPAALDFDDLDSVRRFGPMRTFAMTKSCNLAITGELARRKGSSGITSIAFYPGLVRNETQKKMRGATRVFGLVARIFGSDGQRAGEALARLGLDDPPANGGYFKLLKPASVLKAMQDDKLGRQLWETSERLVRQEAV